jgi:hypothetical protein
MEVDGSDEDVGTRRDAVKQATPNNSVRGERKLTWQLFQGWGSESGCGERLQSLDYLIGSLTRNLEAKDQS